VGETLALFEPSFNRSVKVEARAERLSSDAGAILLREALDRSGIIEDLAAELTDPRDPRFIEHPLPELLRSLVLLFAQGWEDLSDVGPLRTDPVLALARSARRGVGAGGSALASQPTLSRLLDTLARPENAPVIEGAALALAGRRLRAANRGRRRRRLTLDVDGLPLPVHGAQPGSAYNGHVGARIHYPLIASCAETGDMLGALLRPGNAGPAAEAKEWIPQIVASAERELCQHAQVRLDAGFTDGETLEALDARGIGYIGRLRDNAALQRLFDPHRRRGPGRPAERPREWIVERRYRAGSWARERRVLIVVQERPDELFRRCFYLVTNLTAPPTQLLALYRRRGKAEGHMGELKDGFGASLPSTSRGRASEAVVLARSRAWLALRLLAYELLHWLRAPLERATGEGWSLRRVRERLLKTAARVQRSGRRLIVVLTRAAAQYWRVIFPRLQRPRPAPG